MIHTCRLFFSLKPPVNRGQVPVFYHWFWLLTTIKNRTVKLFAVSLIPMNFYLFQSLIYFLTTIFMIYLFQMNFCYSNHQVRNIHKIKRWRTHSIFAENVFFLNKISHFLGKCSSSFYLMHIFQCLHTNSTTSFDSHQYYSTNCDFPWKKDIHK
jgi:hypothetical protein